MAITAETRNSIIELVVTAYNAPPGTALLTDLVAIVEDGGSLADVATALTTSDTWAGLYPSFQTAEEFAAEWLGNLVPEAGEDALAGGIDIAVGLINGGSSFADIILVAQNFLANLSEDDAEFGSSAANFNNKVEVATYHTVTLELDADTVAELQEVLVSVTSDDDSVGDANTAAQASVPGETVALTTGLDSGAAFTTGSTNDVFSAVDAGDGDIDTLTTGDSLDGGLGTDTLSLAVSGNANASDTISTTSIENVKVYNNSSATYTLDATLMSGLTDVFVTGGTSATVVETAGVVNLHLINTDQTATVTADDLDGSSDASIVLVNGADTTAIYNGLETINLVAVGSASEITLVSADLETVNVSGDGDVDVTAVFSGIDTDAKVNVLDASAATGDVDATVVPGVDVYTHIALGSGDDNATFTGAVTDDVTISGGEGTDSLTLTSAVAYDAEAETQAGANISGIEALVLAGGSVDGRALTGNAESTIDSLTAAGDATATYLPIASVLQVDDGEVTLSDSGVTGLTVTLYDAESTLSAAEAESLTVLSAGAESTDNNSLTMDAEGSAALTSVVAAGSNQLSIDIAGELLASVNAAGVTGTETFTLVADGGADVTVTPSSVRPLDAEAETANDLTTGAGDDTISGSAYNDVIAAGSGANHVAAGSGDDTVTAGSGADTIMGGAGDDDITAGDGANYITGEAGDDAIDAGEGADTVMGGAGDDTITVGNGNNVVTGEAGDDSITAGEDENDLSGGAGDDTITAGRGDDTISGGDGDDTITAGRGDNLIDAGEGDDTIILHDRGNDTVDAGAGDDTIGLSAIDEDKVIDGGEGTDAMLNLAALDAEAAYQDNAAFVSTEASAEDVVVTATGIESLWLSMDVGAEGAGNDSVLDLSGSTDLTSLYLDITGEADERDGAEGLVTMVKGIQASSLTLGFLTDVYEEYEEADADPGGIRFTGDGQDITITVIEDDERSADLETALIFKDFGDVVFNAPVTDLDSEDGEHATLELEGGLIFDDVDSVTLNFGSGTNANGDTMYEAGEYDEFYGVTILADEFQSLSINVGDGGYVYIYEDYRSDENVDAGQSVEYGRAEDGSDYASIYIGGEDIEDLDISITVGDNAYLEIGYPIDARHEGVTVDIEIGEDSEVNIDEFVLGDDASITIDVGTRTNLYVEGFDLGEDSSVIINARAGAYVELEDVEYSGSMTINSDFGAEIYLDSDHGIGEEFTLTLVGEGYFDGGTASISIDSDADAYTLDASGWNDATGEDLAVTVTGTNASTSLTFIGDFAGITNTAAYAASAEAEEFSFTYASGEANVELNYGESDDTVVTANGDDVIDVGGGTNEVTAGGGDNAITLTGGASVEDYDTINGLNVAEAAGENDTIVIGDTVAAAGAVTVLGDIAAAEAFGVGEASAEVEAADVIATVTDGIMTLASEDAEALAAFDTLDEYVAAALLSLTEGQFFEAGAELNVDEITVGFVFDGATWIVSATDVQDTAEAALAVDDLIKLTGLSGEETLGTAAAADTIVVG